MKISILCPTRHRLPQLKKMVASARSTATHPLEFVLYVDDDDSESCAFGATLKTVVVTGPRITLTDTWNKCFERCTGDIVMQANDDVIFRTPGWDALVRKAFSYFPDRILLVHGRGLQPRFDRNFGTHPFVHRRWVETVGYFIPPYFKCEWGDTWLNDVANFLARRCYAPFVVEHMHFSEGKAKYDTTYAEQLEHQYVCRMLYAEHAMDRLSDAAKLKAVMTLPTKAKVYSFSKEDSCVR